MTITIIEANDGLRYDDITWTVTGGCHYISKCSNCQFGALINFVTNEFSCLHYREQFINYTHQTLLPYTFDTDDYPEYFI